DARAEPHVPLGRGAGDLVDAVFLERQATGPQFSEQLPQPGDCLRYVVLIAADMHRRHTAAPLPVVVDREHPRFRLDQRVQHCAGEQRLSQRRFPGARLPEQGEAPLEQRRVHLLPAGIDARWDGAEVVRLGGVHLLREWMRRHWLPETALVEHTGLVVSGGCGVVVHGFLLSVSCYWWVASVSTGHRSPLLASSAGIIRRRFPLPLNRVPLRRVVLLMPRFRLMPLHATHPVYGRAMLREMQASTRASTSTYGNVGSCTRPLTVSDHGSA